MATGYTTGLWDPRYPTGQAPGATTRDPLTAATSPAMDSLMGGGSSVTGMTAAPAPETFVKAPQTADPTLADDHTETMVGTPSSTPVTGTPTMTNPDAPGTTATPRTPMVDPQAAKEAAFARAKDAIGQQMRASMTALREGLAGRGALGGGVEQGGMVSLLGGGVQDLQDVVTGQAAFDVAGNNDLANRNYEGALQKRGQDLGLTQSLLSLLGGSGAY